jgi:hypothetical protein
MIILGDLRTLMRYCDDPKHIVTMSTVNVKEIMNSLSLSNGCFRYHYLSVALLSVFCFPLHKEQFKWRQSFLSINFRNYISFEMHEYFL